MSPRDLQAALLLGRDWECGQAAASGLVRPVDSLVHTEAGLPAEGLPALGALVGLLPRVDAQVQPQGRPLAECFATLSAFIGFLPRVSSHVNDEL